VNDAIAICDLEDSPIRLWLLDLNVSPDAAQCRLLSALERERALKFRAENDRRRYLVAHCALRLLIQDFAGVDAERIEFSVGPWGKPSLCQISGVYFSISYADDRALVGLTSIAEIGVDIETVRMIEDSDELTKEYFTETEQCALTMIETAEARQRCFLQGWARKEACIKAVGLGLSLHPATFTSGVSDERTVCALPLADGPVLVEVRTVSLGHDLVGAWSIVL